jgi:hypothetical protein
MLCIVSVYRTVKAQPYPDYQILTLMTRFILLFALHLTTENQWWFLLYGSVIRRRLIALH